MATPPSITAQPQQYARLWETQSRLIREQHLQDSLAMFVDLGLTPYEMSLAANLPLKTVLHGLARLTMVKSSPQYRTAGAPRRASRDTGQADPGKADRGTADFKAQQKEIDHRIANSIQLATSILNTASRQISDVASAQAALRDASARLMAIARMHRQLSQNTPDNTVDLADFLKPVCADISTSIGAIFIIHANDVTLPANAAMQICIILTELALNAVKHGAQKEKPVVLTLEAQRNPQRQLQISLRDNGRGLPSGFSLHDTGGLGMSIITAIVEKLGGSLSTLTGDGAGFEITLPPASRASSSRAMLL